MNDTLFEALLALRQKRALTADEQSRLDGWLAAHPGDRTRWLEEIALSTVLNRLPEPPVPSNFLARVWQGIEAEEKRGARASTAAGWRAWLRWPSLATQFACVVLLLATVAVVIVQGRRVRSHTQVAQSIERIAAIASGPNVELLKDFEAISRLNQSAADVELLAAFERER